MSMTIKNIYIKKLGTIYEIKTKLSINLDTYPKGPPISQLDFALKLPVNAAGCHRDQPWGVVRDAGKVWPIVPGGSRGQDPSPHGVERTNCYAVPGVARHCAADGDGDDVDALVYGGVERREQVHV